MFGIYELLAIFSFISLGYKAFFYAILGVLTHDVSYRVGTEPALWVGSVGLFLIEILGVFNTVFFIGLVITCFFSRQLLAWIIPQVAWIQAQISTVPQGQKLLSSLSIAASFACTVLRFLAATSYIKPFTTLDGWVNLAATCRERIANANTTAYALTTAVIYKPLVEKGGVRAERILGCWNTIRQEIVTQIIIYRVKLAQTLISCNQYYPVVVAGLTTMKDNPAMMNGMMAGMGMPAMTAAPRQVAPQKEIGDDTMDMMRDFIQTTEAAQATVAPATTTAVNTNATNTINTGNTNNTTTTTTTTFKASSSARAQRAAVEAAAAAPAATDAIPEAQKAQLKTMLLNTLAAQNIKWDKLNKTQRAMYVRRFDTMLAASGADFKGFSVGEILGK